MASSRIPQRIGWLLICSITALADCAQTAAADGEILYLHDRDLQMTLDAAPPQSVIQCDPNRLLTLSVPVRIRKAVTLIGLHAQLPPKLGSTPLLVVEAKGVALTDFELIGNGDSVPQSERAPLLIIHAGDFRVERGRMLNSSKDGVMIDADGPLNEDIVGGVVRDIVGRGVHRDVVSISGSDGHGHLIRNVLVDNVRCYDSDLRGAVEVSDGTDNITVRKVYAESAVYAIDVQDHKKPGQNNRHVLIEDIYALHCKHALRTANSTRGHANLTIRDITARQCSIPVQISHTENVHLSNVRVLDHEGEKAPVQLEDCRGVMLRDLLFQDVVTKAPALLLQNCEGVILDGLNLRGQSNRVSSAVYYRISGKKALSGLRISNVIAHDVTETGILLEATGKEQGTLSDYVVTGNLTTVRDHIQGQRALILNNLP